jgi:hypothetical protein
LEVLRVQKERDTLSVMSRGRHWNATKRPEIASVCSAMLFFFAVAFPVFGNDDALPLGKDAPRLALPTDCDQFFGAYARVAASLQAQDTPRIVVHFAELVAQTPTSPWREIAQLKQAEYFVSRNDFKTAEPLLQNIQERTERELFFQSKDLRTSLLRTALFQAAENGLKAVRLSHIRLALGEFFAKNGHYPESLPRLVVENYIENDRIRDAKGRVYLYIPTSGPLGRPLRYNSYTLENAFAEPPLPQWPKLDSITAADVGYVAVLRASARSRPLSVREGDDVGNFHVVRICRSGVVLTTPTRVIALPLQPQ